jgi:hypothetical protein
MDHRGHSGCDQRQQQQEQEPFAQQDGHRHRRNASKEEMPRAFGQSPLSGRLLVLHDDQAHRGGRW